MKPFLAQTLQLPWMNDSQIEVKGNLEGSPFLGSILSDAMEFVFIFAGVGLFLMLLAAGFAFLTSAGDPKKLSQAQGRLTNALLGFVIIFAAYWMVKIFGTIFGLDSVKDIFGVVLFSKAPFA